MSQAIPSSRVGVKINEWYKMIRQFSVPDAEVLKAEVEQDIQQMEEDQDLLIYYSLMCFRHQLMLDYLEPGQTYGNRPTVTELLETIETPQKKLTGLLKYYSLFFRGMYEFDQKEYVEAIGYYREAEKELPFVSDEIEIAEFHFKVAEAYYHMKQTHVSMHHILQALDIYQNYPLYSIRTIQSLFVIAGNYDDFKHYDKALPHLEKALELAMDIQNDRFIAISLLNIANSYDRSGDDHKAVEHFQKAAKVSREKVPDLLPNVLFGLSWTLCKADQTEKAFQFIEEGLEHMGTYPNAGSHKLYKELYLFLQAVYKERADETKILEMLAYFEKKNLYAYIEACARSAAAVFESRCRFEHAAAFYRKVLKAQEDMLKGECLYAY
ncbi:MULTISPECIES: Rap family tetratricopeptide repeat protein [unclassified Bacillus (in: firmicutes)]|uniref:response regulator aspartate phosphatase n=1 Tax=unclassified Bacillus (in: firmicutes) TaxID=185979 RepID=UPI002281A80F|nr:tetratricopeptide repeat protein [Bacillus sp. S20C3]MCY8289851.1 tetratricopeptide repeat protein [Bacillus sp. N13C7]MCY8638841.1 tetratricopeptide repeat protein [Bacillus sp. S17B2]MCY8718521.1 tetratricopeptide repeat protein [Bacillus sp. S10C12M]MCY9145034.1 tetratricopeptide repeat protein [Bacillus sp. T9C1]